jgi:putative ABC transport system permease protein
MRWFGSREKRYEQQLDEELRFHMDEQIAQYVAEGMTPREARRRALIEFGGPTQIKEECREVRRANPASDLTQDVRYALRMIRKRPIFAVVAVAALALGIGANTAVFSIVNAILLRPFDFPDPDRLVSLRGADPHRPNVALMITPADYYDWTRRCNSFKSMSASTIHDYVLRTDGGDPESIRGVQVTSSFLSTLGAKPALGRPFRRGEDEPGHDQVVLLSDTLWRQRFAADRSVVGRTILLDGRRFLIIGIMPQGFEFPLPAAALWTPMALTPAEREDRRTQYLMAAARLRDGVSISQAQAELMVQAQRLEKEHPDTNINRSAGVVPLREWQGEFSKPFMTLLQATALFVLLIACANLANLQLANAVSRKREIALRAALGAGRWRVVRLLLIESIVIALVGGAAAIVVAYWGVAALKASVPAQTSRYIGGWNGISLQTPVLVFTLIVAVLSGVVFGLSAALQAVRVDLTGSLKDGSQQGGSKARLRPFLVVGEVMLAVVAVMGASQMVRGFRAIVDAYQGFSPDGVFTMRLVLPKDTYDKLPKAAAFFDRTLASVATIPNVQGATISSNLPGALHFNVGGPMVIEGRPALRPSETPSVDYQYVGPGHFNTLAIPIRSGREVNAQDGEQSPLVAVISEGLAARYWPGEDPLGKRIRPEGAGPAWRTIVGVVADVHQFWFQKEPRPLLYLPYRQAPQRSMYVALRAHGDPMALLTGVRQRVRELDPALPVEDPQPLPELMQQTLSGMRLTTGMMMTFGIIALVLSAVGVYGVMAYSVTQRNREFGIRLALGARPRAVLRMVLGEGLTLALAGVVAGLAGGYGISRLMSGIMFGVASNSPAVLAGVPMLLALVSLAACWIPARAVTSVDPFKTLRQD